MNKIVLLLSEMRSCCRMIYELMFQRKFPFRSPRYCRTIYFFKNQFVWCYCSYEKRIPQSLLRVGFIADSRVVKASVTLSTWRQTEQSCSLLSKCFVLLGQNKAGGSWKVNTYSQPSNQQCSLTKLLRIDKRSFLDKYFIYASKTNDTKTT